VKVQTKCGSSTIVQTYFLYCKRILNTVCKHFWGAYCSPLTLNYIRGAGRKKSGSLLFFFFLLLIITQRKYLEDLEVSNIYLNFNLLKYDSFGITKKSLSFFSFDRSHEVFQFQEMGKILTYFG